MSELYGYEIQGWHGDGYGWESVSVTDTVADSKKMLAYYRAEQEWVEFRVMKVRMNFHV